MRFILFAIIAGALSLSLIWSATEGDFAVLFAQNHNEIYDLEGEDLLSLQRFASLLRDQGVSVLSLKRGEIDEEVLGGVNVLVLSFPQSNLTSGEMAAITGYVERGGGLLVLGGQVSREYLNPLLRKFGIEMGYDVLQRDGSLDILLPAGSHDIFQFVREFEYYHAPAVRVADRGWIVYKSPMFGDDWAIFAYREYGKGRVFVSGDADFVNDFFLDAHDNAQLGYNIVLYTGGRRPVELEEKSGLGWPAALLVVLALLVLFVRKKMV